MLHEAAIPGLLTPWLQARYPGQPRVRSVFVYPGGASNLTCRVDLEGARWPAAVLRVQRERGIFEPYDVLREGQVIEALRGTTIPVPELYASEPDRAYLGAPFLLMEWVDAPHMGEAPPGEASFPAFAAMVARIHDLDWRASGLGFLGVPGSAREALLGELDAVEARYERFARSEAPVLGEALAVLRRAAPGDGALRLCQGDINVYNYLVRGGQVAAVIDWEQARISDPRSDIGQLIALSHLKGAPFGPADEQGFAQLYRGCGGDARGLAFFRARWLTELGVIYFGWKAFNASSPWYELDHLVELLSASLAEL